MSALQLTKGNFEQKLKEKDIMVVDFWAPWCGPCKAFGPIFDKVADSNPDITFGKINTEEEMELSAQFGIRSIPTLMVYREGEIVFYQPGMVPEDALNDLLKQVKALDMDEVRKEIQKKQAEAAPN